MMTLSRLTSQALAFLLFTAGMGSGQVQAESADADDPVLHGLVLPCLTCHSVDAPQADEAARADLVGPSLYGVFGRRIASLDGYEYSSALYRKAAVGKRWDESELDAFLQSPQTMAPGVAMVFEGIADAAERASVIAWLATGPLQLTAESEARPSLLHQSEVAQVLDNPVDVEYGQYLAGTCLTCHSAPGSGSSVPPLHGLPADYFVNALLEYQQGERGNPIMQTMANSLDERALAALASYFSPAGP